MNAEFDVTGVVLETERLILREWRLDDVDDMFEYASVPDVGNSAGWPPHKSKEDSLAIVTRFIEKKRTFAIVYKENNKVIGSVGIELYGSEDKLTEFTNYKGREIGYVLSKDYWGKGLMTEAVKKVINYLFNELDYDFLLCGHYDVNHRSSRVQDKCGFLPYRKLVFDTQIGSKEPGILRLLINHNKDIVFNFSHPGTLIYGKKFILETGRLILREMVDEDYDDLKKVISDPENMNYYSAPYDDEGVSRWLNWCKDCYQKYGFGLWAVVLKKTGEMIGDCGISMQMIDDEYRPEIGYHLRKDYHQQGIGKEMTRAVKDYFFNNYNYDEVYSYMNKDNVASYKTAEANGMSFLHNYITKSGEECRVYRITKEEWKKAR